jgi:2-polyprenyl-6-methoxyphenol hydroxylase-like FAD-dependent oxidoreductase
VTNPVLIIGAGPVGLTMAAALTQHGVKCRLIEKTALPNDKSKALVVWCRTLELLDGLGLAEEFVRTGLKINGGSMYANGERLVHLLLTSDESPFGFPLMIPQNKTEELLTEHLAKNNVSIERHVELVTFHEISDGVRCTLRHADGSEEFIETPWVIGCDGAHSTVRHTLGVEFTGFAEPNDWMLADVHIAGPLAKDEVSIYWHERGVVAFFPIDQNRFRMISDLGPASQNTIKEELTLHEVQTTINERGPAGLNISDPVWMSYFRINERKVADYRQGRVMLAGDAAHIHSPAGGQGMNTGMQDAFNLAWKLALIAHGQGQSEPLLQSYTLERSAVGDRVLKNAERFTTMATLRSPVAQWLRNHIVPILGSFDFVQDKIRNEWFELAINYRHSPLSTDQWLALTGGLMAGDRLCDAPLMAAANVHRTTIFSIINSTAHTLLLLPGLCDPSSISQLFKIAANTTEVFPEMFSTHMILKNNQSVTGLNAFNDPLWIDVDDRLHQKLHAKEPTLVLVRPDGYIGFRCQPADGQALIDHLSTYLNRTS